MREWLFYDPESCVRACGGVSGHIDCDVVEGDLPLLLSTSAMKSMEIQLDLQHKRSTISIKGQPARKAEFSRAVLALSGTYSVSKVRANRHWSDLAQRLSASGRYTTHLGSWKR